MFDKLDEKTMKNASLLIELMHKYHEKYHIPKEVITERIDCVVCGEKDSFTISVSSYNGHVCGGCNKCKISMIE